MQNLLFEKLDMYSEDGFLDNYKETPLYIIKNLNPQFKIRNYQEEAFARFGYYFNDYKNKKLPIHLLFNMATGSGKTFVMASLILELYEKGYRNFLFFVNSTNIIEKTKENFLNNTSSKYLFNDKVTFDGKNIKIKEVSNFTTSKSDDINIKFTTIQGLHSDLNAIKEDGLSYSDFEDNKIVILSDEAHHINATTKKGKLNKGEEESKVSWENTVMNILNSNDENLLLEFTATIDLGNEFIAEKYSDKIIYKYDLKDFRLDGYSKEVDILKADMEQNDRILQALILSQYRLKIAERNNIRCKPVILFKAQKTVAESEENLSNFTILIKNLKAQDLQKIKDTNSNTVIAKAFSFFEENNISLDDIVLELQTDFASENCLSANDNKDTAKNQILLNTLEDTTNNIRAVFAVQKLNEGWDVLNLFDIVRLYGDDGKSAKRSNVIDKKTGKVKVGPQTISEAQLIGRGARYFPFSTDKALGEDKYKRKFDNKDEEELKILETFYYHTFFDKDGLYITEIRKALIETGMMDEKEKKDFRLELKQNFKESDLFKQGVIYTNKRKVKDTTHIDSLEKVGLKKERFEFILYSGKSGDIKVFDDVKTIKQNDTQLEKKPLEIKIKDIDKKIILKALSQNDFYKFSHLTQYFGGLQSIDEFIESENYLQAKIIDLYAPRELLDRISIYDKLKAVSSLLRALESEIKKQEIQYEGTTDFIAQTIKNTFYKDDRAKSIKVDLGDEGFTNSGDWFAFEEIHATTEEKAFIKLFEKKIKQLEEKYTDIYLLRSERQFALYSFDDGDRFEPDFVLFMKDKQNDNPLTYQIFIEPKGNHLLETDEWKNKFLLQIEDNYKFSEDKVLKLDLEDYHLIGLPFYNKDSESEFEEAFDDKLMK